MQACVEEMDLRQLCSSSMRVTHSLGAEEGSMVPFAARGAVREVAMEGLAMLHWAHCTPMGIRHLALSKNRGVAVDGNEILMVTPIPHNVQGTKWDGEVLTNHFAFLSRSAVAAAATGCCCRLPPLPPRVGPHTGCHSRIGRRVWRRG